jgi:hypothetical protein
MDFFPSLIPKKSKSTRSATLLARIEFHKKEKMEKHQRRLLLVDLLPSREYGNISALGNTEQEIIQLNSLKHKIFPSISWFFYQSAEILNKGNVNNCNKLTGTLPIFRIGTYHSKINPVPGSDLYEDGGKFCNHMLKNHQPIRDFTDVSSEKSLKTILLT